MGEAGLFEHEVRDAARRAEWAAAAARRPRDMDGVQAGIDRGATTALLSGRGGRRGLSPYERGTLRTIICGGQWSRDRRHPGSSANCAQLFAVDPFSTDLP